MKADYPLKIKPAPLSSGSLSGPGPGSVRRCAWLGGASSASAVGGACLHPSPSSDTRSGSRLQNTLQHHGRQGGAGSRENLGIQQSV